MISWRRLWCKLRGARIIFIEDFYGADDFYGSNIPIKNACLDYIRDNNLNKYNFMVEVYGYKLKGSKGVYSHVNITYPSVSAHLPGFDSALKEFETYVRDFVRSRYDYSIQVISKMQEESMHALVKSKFAKIVPPGIPITITPGYISRLEIQVREDQYNMIKKKTGKIGKVRYRMRPYSIQESLFPFYDNKHWDHVDVELYRLGYLNYAYSRMLYYYMGNLDTSSSDKGYLETVNNRVVDLAELGDDISQIVRDEIERAPDSDEKIIVLPLTGATKLMFEIVSDHITYARDGYKPLLFEGKEIVPAKEEIYDYALWFMSARSNLINIFHEHRAELNTLLCSQNLPWVLKYLSITDSFGLSERELFLVESSLALLERATNGINWIYTNISERWNKDCHLHPRLFDLFNKEFRDRFKLLDSRVGRFDDENHY